jgi:nucleoside-diphosphate-sugar epimerase
MKVLVTGATSMIGRKTAEELLRRGHDVQILQRGSSDLEVPIFRGDIRDADAVQKAVSGCDVVIHAAAKVGLVGRFSEFRDINVVGTQHVMSAAVAAGARGVVYVSSPSVSYSTTPVLGAVSPPARDDVLGYYSQTKSVAERAVLADTRIAAVALRPHLVWGPGDTQLVGRIVERARQRRLALVDNGEAVVDSTYIDNVSDALAAAAERVGVQENLSGRALVVSNGEPRTVASLVQSICSAANVPYAPRNFGLGAAVRLGKVIEAVYKLRPHAEPPLTAFTAYQLGISHWFDISETKELLQWSPRISLDEGFALLAQSFASPHQ